MPKRFDLSHELLIGLLPKYIAQVEDCINNTLNTDNSLVAKTAMRVAAARGKRLRPALVIASALLSGMDVSPSVIQAAAAVELIHIGSLVHDDIIDKAKTRWNIATINAREGQDYAIITGDFLFAKGCVLAGMSSRQAGILAAETIAKLCSGQSSEMAALYDYDRSEEKMNTAIQGKTAALTAAACRLGGICANISDDKQEALELFGNHFGMSFQLIDDVLDFVSSEELAGKPVGNDVKDGVYSLPVILSLESSNRSAVIKELGKKSVPSRELMKILFDDKSFDMTLELAKEHASSAEKILTGSFGKTAANLSRLPKTYLDWAVSSLVSADYLPLLSK